MKETKINVNAIKGMGFYNLMIISKCHEKPRTATKEGEYNA